MVILKSHRTFSTEETMRMLKQKLALPPDIRIECVKDDASLSSVIKGGSGILYFTGTDFDSIERAIAASQNVLKNTRSGSTIEPVLKKGKPELVVTLDKEKLSAFGVTLFGAAKSLHAMVAGSEAGVLYDGDMSIPIMVRLREEDRSSERALEGLFVKTSSGKQVPLSSFAHTERGSGYAKIIREDASRTTAVEIRRTDGARSDAQTSKILSYIQKTAGGVRRAR